MLLVYAETLATQATDDGIMPLVMVWLVSFVIVCDWLLKHEKCSDWSVVVLLLLLE